MVLTKKKLNGLFKNKKSWVKNHVLIGFHSIEFGLIEK